MDMIQFCTYIHTYHMEICIQGFLQAQLYIALKQQRRSALVWNPQTRFFTAPQGRRVNSSILLPVREVFVFLFGWHRGWATPASCQGWADCWFGGTYYECRILNVPCGVFVCLHSAFVTTCASHRPDKHGEYIPSSVHYHHSHCNPHKWKYPYQDQEFWPCQFPMWPKCRNEIRLHPVLGL